MRWPGTVGFWEVSRNGNVKILAEMHLGVTWRKKWGNNAADMFVDVGASS